jgi:hypothetical protein
MMAPQGCSRFCSGSFKRITNDKGLIEQPRKKTCSLNSYGAPLFQVSVLVAVISQQVFLAGLRYPGDQLQVVAILLSFGLEAQLHSRRDSEESSL